MNRTETTILGTAMSASAIRVMLLGSGELGKEVVIELQRLGIEVIAVDRYQHAPAMALAHRSYVIDMLNETALRALVEKEQPHYIVPEVEAIATATLVELEQEGFCVVPSAKATQLTMNREGIRRLAAETLGLATSSYCFAEDFEAFAQAVEYIGFPCLVKPIMSSSGKGQSLLRQAADINTAWSLAQEGGRAGRGKVIVEGLVDFDDEITLLTIRHKDGTSFCQAIGHVQVDGDYRESWQPHVISQQALAEAQAMAKTITDALGGYGLFGVELFIKDDRVLFSEVSPRPHDTGLVTLISQDLSEFALHVRAILGLPIHHIQQYGAAASCPLVIEGRSAQLSLGNIGQALQQQDTQLYFFGKPKLNGKRRMAVSLAKGDSIEQARDKAKAANQALSIHL